PNCCDSALTTLLKQLVGPSELTEVKSNLAFIGSGHRIETGLGRDSQDPPVALVTRQRDRTVTICMGYHHGRELTSLECGGGDNFIETSGD
ncbi:Hypothetical predicted protein, partial [Marmota monax]